MGRIRTHSKRLSFGIAVHSDPPGLAGFVGAERSMKGLDASQKLGEEILQPLDGLEDVAKIFGAIHPSRWRDGRLDVSGSILIALVVDEAITILVLNPEHT